MDQMMLPPDAPDPGSYVDRGNGTRTWSGPMQWSRAIEGSRVDYLLGRPNVVDPVILPDGSHAIAHRMMDVGTYLNRDPWIGWRVDQADGRVLRGDLTVAPGVPLRFIPKDAPQPEWERRAAFEQALAADPELRTEVANRDFAEELYAALCNNEFIELAGGADAERYSCSWRYAGGLVAQLRGLGEEYIDFYCGGDEATVTPRIRQALKRCGWRLVKPDEEICP